MTAAPYSITIEQGSDLVIPIQITDDDDVPINLTGYKFALQIRPTVQSKTLYDELTIANGRIEVMAAEGKLFLKWPADVTNSWAFLKDVVCSAVYDFKVHYDGEIKRRLQGDVTISAAVTRVDFDEI